MIKLASKVGRAKVSALFESPDMLTIDFLRTEGFSEKISVVVIGNLSADDVSVESAVRGQLTAWFGSQIRDWRHLKTYRITHALPAQTPPMPDPTVSLLSHTPGIFISGEYGSTPGIQWAMLSGRHAAEAVMNRLGLDG